MPPLILVVLVLLLIVFPVWQSWRARTQLRSRLRTEWGRPRSVERDMEMVADFYRSTASRGELMDDRTWNDLLMNDVFGHLDRTESSIGQQVLYYRLRSASAPRSLNAFEELIATAEKDRTIRERAQVKLAKLRSPAAYYVHRLARKGAVEVPKKWHVVFPIWTAVALITMSLPLFWPGLFVAALICFAINFMIRLGTAVRVTWEIAWFRMLGPLLYVANELTAICRNETEGITGSLRTDLASLKRVAKIVRWVSLNPSGADPIVFTLMELLNVLFLLDANAVYFAGIELQLKAQELLRVIETVGEIDAAIAVASFRAGSRDWIRPSFLSSESSAVFTDIRHPLLDHAVPNSIRLAPPHGVLITGSNMSGKSTFLRTAGVNVVLAQTINTCLAGGYEAPVYQVRSCIGRADDLIAGKSYYLVEVESVLALVRASREATPHLFIFDELFRGTNAVERIAAAEAVLHELISEGTPHVVLAATHDGELVDLLRENYSVYHFGDNVGTTGLVFDYRLMPGPATTRNAIALLQLNGAPESLITRATDLASALDRQRRISDPQAQT